MNEKVFPIKDFSISLGLGTELVRLEVFYSANPPTGIPLLLDLDTLRRLHTEIGAFLQGVARQPGLTSPQGTLQ